MKIIDDHAWDDVVSVVLGSGVKRSDVVKHYAYGIRFGDPMQCRKVNALIADRWSLSGLAWIKRQAWKLVEARGEGETK